MKKPGSQEATEQSKRLEHEDLAGRIVVELKTVKAAVARSYVRAIGRRDGLILSFAKPTLEGKRVLASEWPKP